MPREPQQQVSAMCGIVGYLGRSPAKPILFDLLAKLEYRGYDSCGIAVQGSPLRVFKDALRVKDLACLVPEDVIGTVGVGHTRWATHGGVTPENAHPQMDCSREIAVVHNGIINNYQELRAKLVLEGHHFASATDTEVIAHLIEKYHQGLLEEAIVRATAELGGSWAVVAVAAGERKLVATKQGAPLVIGLGSDGYVVASDAPALLGHATSVIYLEDGDVAIIEDNNLCITNVGHAVQRVPKEISYGANATNKGHYEHYTLKEIMEQPEVIRHALSSYAMDTEGLDQSCLLTPGEANGIVIIACGTSYHAGLVGKHLIESKLNIPVSVINASELANLPAPRASLAIAITQSGETADVLSTVRRLKNAGIPILAITNAPHNSITTIAHQVIYTAAGPEVGVAATKTFVAQLIALFQAVLSSPRLDPQAKDTMTKELSALPALVEDVCARESAIENCAHFLSAYERAFIVGRGVNLPIAYEGALKMKELAYIHAEGYSAGELKHGPFALLDKNTPVIAIIADDETRQTMLSNIHEVAARNSPVIALTYDGDIALNELGSTIIRLPKTIYPYSTVINAVALQLLAYHTAKLRGCPIDFPRNIAKSVTVE